MNCAAVLKLKKVSHVIFDLDGVILDTEKLYTKIYSNIAEKFGKKFDWSIKMQTMGTPGRELSETIVSLLELPLTSEEFYRLAVKQYAEVMSDAELITDTEIIYKNAIRTIAKRFGKIYTPEIQGKVIGTVEKESSRIAIEEMQLPIAVEKFQLEFRQRAHDCFEKAAVSLMPGAEILVKHLYSNKIPLAVATSSSQDSFRMKTERHNNFFNMFSHIVCGGSDPEVKQGKPNPDIFLICASRFVDKPKPENCLVFEDAPSGVKAAVSAGMQVIMVPDENIPETLRKEAHIVIKCLEDAPLEKFGLPPLKQL